MESNAAASPAIANEGYSLIRHLAMVAGGARWESMSIAMFTAYFDASRRPQAGISMAGFVSDAAQWLKFEVEWKSLLPHGIELFHMTDFVNGRGGWEGWVGKSEKQSRKRANFIERLIDCIRRHTRQGFASVVLEKDYRDVDSLWTLREIVGSPYGLVGIGCLGSLKKWADKKHIDYRDILCVLEDGDEGQGEFISRLRKQGFNLIPQSKKNIRRFDACDLSAWRALTIVDDGFRRQLPNTERIFTALKQLQSVVAGKYNTTLGFLSLKKFCKAMGGERR